jgi:hypothetical protein
MSGLASIMSAVAAEETQQPNRQLLGESRCCERDSWYDGAGQMSGLASIMSAVAAEDDTQQHSRQLLGKPRHIRNLLCWTIVTCDSTTTGWRGVGGVPDV